MDFAYSIPLIGGGEKTLNLKSGSSAVFVGANGSGKSRLGSHLELRTPHMRLTHRVGAQRALQIPLRIAMLETNKAQHALWYGDETRTNKEQTRWQAKPTTFLMNDYQRLLSALFSEEFQKAMEHKSERLVNHAAPWPTTRLTTLKNIWDSAIVTRRLLYKDASLHVTVPDQDLEYPGDDMSDGERVLFYLIGQCLEAAS